MAQAFTRPFPECAPLTSTGCTPQYPPSKKYKSTEELGKGSAKCALRPIHFSICSVSPARAFKFDQRPDALITARDSNSPALVTTRKGPLPLMLCTVTCCRASTPALSADSQAARNNRRSSACWAATDNDQVIFACR